ncbi:c-type cytochrome [Qingshengfaniella alkalisoli]|uniref:Cytochrome c family protein n=1 Tax=Qingshengfaniella alkalisoli TaxID=2599296 RepID=A0A5B8IVV4_9RHOB|nr:cytochrome c family protein [Qingshengfaniella alkalisoli]QDY68628.1 cytochrome c family protein [Qingshengfaniella alkalisoli]
MFDTMTFTKVLGGFCGALLVFLLGGWLAESLYHTGGGHGEAHEQAYSIDTGAEEASGEPAEEIDFDALLAEADPAKGESVFRKCQACHKLDGTDGTGPHLNGVVDRAKAYVDGFAYSDALMAMSEESWTPENLSHFIENPRGYAPGTKMSFAGIKKPEDRADLIAYLQTTGG